LSAYPNPQQILVGLWGDVFYIKWLAKWLFIPIHIWSLQKKKLFNRHLSGNEYNILFHDQNPLTGHYELVLSWVCKVSIQAKVPSTSSSDCHLSPSNIETNYHCIHHTLYRDKLLKCQVLSFDWHESLFQSICFLVDEYNMISIRKCTSQTFYNAYLGQENSAIECLQKDLPHFGLQVVHGVLEW